jgi:S-layer protein
MPAQFFGAQAAVTFLNRAFANTSPSNAAFVNQVTNATATLASGADASQATSYTIFAKSFGSAYAGQTAAQLSTLLMTNLGLLPNAPLETALADYITAAGTGNVGIVALQLSSILSTKESDPVYGAAAVAWNNEVNTAAVYSSNTTNSQPQVGDVVAVQTFTLTAGVDAFTGGKGADSFIANATTAQTFTSFDALDGGEGTDTLSLISATGTALSLPATATVKNIETATLVSDNTISGNVASWTGLTSVTAASVGAMTLTVPATTEITATASTLAGGNVTLNGGTAVKLTATGSTASGNIVVGTTVAPTGAITISSTSGTGNAVTMPSIAVAGGTDVSITQAHAHAVNTTQSNGTVTVTGGASTKMVTVSNSAAATASATVAGVNVNSVAITDVNNGSTTKAGTITTVSVDGYSTLGIAANSVTTLSVANGSGNIIIDNSGLTTATNKTLALTVNKLGGGTLDDADIYTTLNVTTTGANSTLANITTGAVTALTVDGDKGLTLTSTAGLSALKTATVKGSAGITADLSGATVTAVDTSATTGASKVTIDAGKATFTGGAGADTVTNSAGTSTKAISLGAGDDSLTMTAVAATPTGKIDGGAGTDNLSMTAALAATASGSASFAGVVTGFEALTLTSATNQTIDLAVLGNFSAVTTSGGNGLTLSNLPSGGKLTLNGAGTAYTIGNSAFAAGTDDTVNLTLTDGSGAGVSFASTGITASGVETFKITTADTQATPTGTFNDMVTLLGNSAKTIVVTGNAGLTLTATSTALTSVDASGIAGTGITPAFTWTSGALAAASVVKGSATGTNTIDASAATGGAVTYTGGTGNDSFTATNGKGNTISVGDGANTVVVSAGNNTITAGKGADTVTATTGNNTVTLGDGTNSFTATTGNNTYTGGTGVDTVTVAGGMNTLTLGAGADVVSITAAGANVNTYSTITDAAAGDTITFANLGTETFNATKVTLAGTAVFQDFANAVIQAGGNASVNAATGWFQFGGDTYVVQSRHDGSGNNASFVNGTDMVVKLAGLVDLSTSTIGGTNTLTLV